MPPEPYIVYNHHTTTKGRRVLLDSTVSAYSPEQAKYIIEQRQRNKELLNAGVDWIISKREYRKKYNIKEEEDTE